MRAFRDIPGLWPAFLSTAALSLSACGDGSESAEGAEDPIRLAANWAALSGRVDSVVSQFAATGSAASGAVSVPCLAGGRTLIGGLADVQLSPVRIDLQADVEFDDCSLSANVLAKGHVGVSQHVAIGGSETLRIETLYSGVIDFQGEGSMSCDVDVGALVDIDGRVVRATGSFCGRAAPTLDIVITPHWRS